MRTRVVEFSKLSLISIQDGQKKYSRSYNSERTRGLNIEISSIYLALKQIAFDK